MPDDNAELGWKHTLNTPYAHLYTTNHLVQAEQRAPVHRLLDDAESTLATLDTEIASLRLQLNRRLAHRNELTCFITNHQFALSRRILHLPPELMLRIFEMACPWACVDVPPELLGEQDSDVSYGANALWALSQVCQSWRMLALSHSPLWCTFSICLEPIVRFRCQVDSLPRRTSSKSRYSSSEAGTYRMQKHLERSRDLPINIAVAADNSSEDWAPVVEPILRALGTQSTRWRSLLLVLDDLDHWRSLQASPTQCFPLLEYMKFDTHPTEDTLELIGSYPALRTVEFEGIIPSLGHGPWQHLKRLVVYSCARTQSLSSVLANLQCLCYMSLEIRVEKAWDVPSTPSTILLPMLETLKLTIDRRYSQISTANIHLPRLLTLIAAPALLHLISIGLTNDALSGIPAFIARSRCQIQTIHIDMHTSHPHSSYVTLRGLLYATPALESLDLIIIIGKNRASPSSAPEEKGLGRFLSLHPVHANERKSPMLPSLATIRIKFPTKRNTAGISSQYIQEMLETLRERFEAGALKSVVSDIALPRMRRSRGFDDDACVREYWRMVEEGRDVRGTWVWSDGCCDFGLASTC